MTLLSTRPTQIFESGWSDFEKNLLEKDHLLGRIRLQQPLPLRLRLLRRHIVMRKPVSLASKHCGKEGAVARCSACKEVSYCNQSHQKADWKQHNPCCKGIIADPKSIWIEVEESEGNGLW
jgi:hypothetical protein